MCDAMGMRRTEGLSNLDSDAKQPLEFQWSAARDVTQGAAFHQFHRNVRDIAFFAYVMNDDNVRSNRS
jgi:hypothetical protein